MQGMPGNQAHKLQRLIAPSAKDSFFSGYQQNASPRKPPFWVQLKQHAPMRRSGSDTRTSFRRRPIHVSNYVTDSRDIL